MEYALLSPQDLQGLKANRLRELEIHHYNFTLEECEEPGRSAQRLASLADLERRISSYRKELEIADEMAGESPERDGDEVAQP